MATTRLSRSQPICLLHHQKSIRFAIPAMIVAFSVLSGCQSKEYRSETELFSNGHIIRSIVQPEIPTDPSARDVRTWVQEWSTDPEWDGRINNSPQLDDSEEGSMVDAARGRFSSVDDIPVHYKFVRVENGSEFQSRLKRRCQAVSHGFVTEHNWEETLTDVVTLTGMREARAEITTIGTDVVIETLQKSHFRRFEWLPFRKWLNTTGRKWLYEVTDLYFEVSCCEQDRHEELARRFRQICMGYGLKLKGDYGFDDFQHSATEFAIDLLQELVKTKTGESITRTECLSLLAWLGLRSEDDPDVVAAVTHLEKTAAKVIVDRYGNEEKFKSVVNELIIRIMGVYWPWAPNNFRYEMKVPGKIIKSNGELLDMSTVQWQFNAHKAYPNGYKMLVKSIAVSSPTFLKLAGRDALATRESMKLYLDLVAELPDVEVNGKTTSIDKVFHIVEKEKSLSALWAYRDALKSIEEERVAQASMARLIELLRIAE